jgi:putative membrane protein
MLRRLAAFLLRLVLSALVLAVAVALVSPGNPENTFGRAVVISVVLSIAWYITLARFLWFLLLPWLLYALVWLVTITAAYGIGPLHALVVALGMTLLSWLVEWLVGVKTFRAD